MSRNKSQMKEQAKELLRSQRALREGLRQIRLERGLSQLDVAERLCVSKSEVAQFESYDANPTLNEIRQYALAVGADVEFIVRPRQAGEGV